MPIKALIPNIKNHTQKIQAIKFENHTKNLNLRTLQKNLKQYNIREEEDVVFHHCHFCRSHHHNTGSLPSAQFQIQGTVPRE